MARTAQVHRVTAETDIKLALDVDGRGSADVATGVGFLDHMLTLFAKHGAFDLRVRAEGDLHIDCHHTVEDVGLCLGAALRDAIGDKAGIRRYGAVTLPMDETLVTVAVDLSGRPAVVWRADFPTERLGQLDTEMIEHFWRSFAVQAGANYHAVLHHGDNSHHIAEALFKASARALREATEQDPRGDGVPSTKGSL